jgi:hypothetical protein
LLTFFYFSILPDATLVLDKPLDLILIRKGVPLRVDLSLLPRLKGRLERLEGALDAFHRREDRVADLLNA